MANILITGGSGFIASHTIPLLVEAGHRVRALDVTVPLRAISGVERCLGDIRDRNAVFDALVDIDTVYHMASLVGVGQSMYAMAEYADINVNGTAILLEEIAARRQQIRRIILSSSVTVYGEGTYQCSACLDKARSRQHGPDRSAAQLILHEWEPKCQRCNSPMAVIPTREDDTCNPASIYAQTKWMQEKMVLAAGRAYHIATVTLRYFNVYGPGQPLGNPYAGLVSIFSKKILSGEPPTIYEDGLQSRDMVHVDDVARANVMALAGSVETGGKPVNIGSGVGRPVKAIAGMLAERIDPAVLLNIVATEQYRSGDVRHCVADISRARSVLGWEPRVAFSDGLDGYCEWLMKLREGGQQGRQCNGMSVDANAELVERGLVR